MWIPEKREISQADYERYKDKNSVDKELEEFVGWAAHFFAMATSRIWND